eukprot:g2936.t1
MWTGHPEPASSLVGAEMASRALTESAGTVGHPEPASSLVGVEMASRALTGSAGTVDNATLEYRLGLQADSPANLAIGIIHILWFLIGFATSSMWWSQIRFRMRIFGFWGVSKGMFLVFLLHVFCTLNEVSYMGFISGGFKRSGGVVGDPAYAFDQFGYLNSASTGWCNFTSYLLYFSLNSMLLTLALIIHDTHKLAVKPIKSSSIGRRSSLMEISGSKCNQCITLMKRNPLAPDPLVEGTIGLTDYISLMIMPAAVYTFSLELWMGLFGSSRNSSLSRELSSQRRSDLSTARLSDLSTSRFVSDGADDSKANGTQADPATSQVVPETSGANPDSMYVVQAP